jgi:hypothetical protein
MRYADVLSLTALVIMLGGCANTKTATGAMAHGVVEAACVVAHKGVDLAFGPITDFDTDATAVVEAVTGAAK